MEQRLQKVRDLLKENNLDAYLISSVPNIIYLTDYSGFSPLEREAFILVTFKENIIFTDARYSEEIKSALQNFTLIKRTSSFHENFKEIAERLKIQTLGIEENNLTVAEYKILSKIFKRTESVNFESLRIIKDNDEISAIKKACDIGDKAFSHVLKKINSNMTELEVAWELELFIRKAGGQLSFPTIVAFGKNSAIPHHHTDNTKVKSEDVVLLDFGVKYNNYCSDMTRTVFIGKPTLEQKKVYLTVLESQQKAVAFLQSSISDHQSIIKTSDVDKTARDYIVQQHFPSIPHALGHGIGLDVHEAPTLSPKSHQTLTEGMVFSIEPGIYLPQKLGVRIEDLFTIQNNMLIQLTKSSTKLISL